jgi:hypothetical protein
MSVDHAVDSPAAAPAARSGPRASLWVLRVVAVVHAAAVVAQPVLAGRYLGGDFGALTWHRVDGSLLPLATMVQFAAALAYFVGRGRGWPVLFSVVLFLAEGIQIGMGYSHELAIHLPLGVGIVLAQILFTVWLFRPGAAQPRRWWIGGRRAR